MSLHDKYKTCFTGNQMKFVYYHSYRNIINED
jgi:hypothetical protein